MNPGELLVTIALIRSLSPVRTVSIETSPNHLEPEVLRRCRDAGVSRFEVGVQSFDDGLLAGMGRLEKSRSGGGIRARPVCVRGLFPTLDVDMILNLPGQSLAMQDADIDALLERDVDQASFCPLMTAPSAWCFSRGEGMFDGYIIDQDDYAGMGSGDFSYVGGQMYSTRFSLGHYCRRVEGGQSGITQRRTLGRKRMRYDSLVRLFGAALRHQDIAPRHDADALRLRRRGMYCWVLMMTEFFNSVNDVREHIRVELDAWNEEAKVPVSALGGISRGQGLARGGGR